MESFLKTHVDLLKMGAIASAIGHFTAAPGGDNLLLVVAVIQYTCLLVVHAAIKISEPFPSVKGGRK